MNKDFTGAGSILARRLQLVSASANFPEVKKLKNLVLMLMLLTVVLSFSGCTGNGSSEMAFTPPDEEIAAVEGSLLVDRVLAATALEASDSALVPATAELRAAKRFRNRAYSAESRSGGLYLRRGDGSCGALVSSDSLMVGNEQCRVVRLDDGSLQLTRGNGSVIEFAMASENPSSMVINGVEWQITFGVEVGEPLASLKNMRSGLVLTVTELDDGSLTIVRDNSEVFAGRWADSGDLEITDGRGRQFRYRYGCNN